MTKWVVCCDKSKKFNQEESVYMTDLRTHVYSKFYLPSGICNSCWDQSILQLRFRTAWADKRRAKVNTEKECLRFSRSWRKWAITDGCQKEVEYTQQRQGTEWMGECLSEKSYATEDTFTSEGIKLLHDRRDRVLTESLLLCCRLVYYFSASAKSDCYILSRSNLLTQFFRLSRYYGCQQCTVLVLSAKTPMNILFHRPSSWILFTHQDKCNFSSQGINLKDIDWFNIVSRSVRLL